MLLIEANHMTKELMLGQFQSIPLGLQRMIARHVLPYHPASRGRRDT